MSAFERAFKHTVGIEGGFVDDPRDSGGATNFGITERVARANGYTGLMPDMTIEFARSVYKQQYWDTLRLDEIAELSESISAEMFDTGVNCGIAVAGKFLQRSLNALNRESRDYPDMTVDGIVGPMTVSALRSYLAKRSSGGEIVMLRALNALQGERYIVLAETRQKDEAFVFGWMLNRVA